MQEAEELKALDVLGAHARDELGINEITQAKPLQAALASVGAFIFGGVLPLIVARVGDGAHGLLALLGSFAAKTGGSSIGRAVLRITFWGTITMGITALIGYLFGVNLA